MEARNLCYSNTKPYRQLFAVKIERSKFHTSLHEEKHPAVANIFLMMQMCMDPRQMW